MVTPRPILTLQRVAVTGLIAAACASPRPAPATDDDLERWLTTSTTAGVIRDAADARDWLVAPGSQEHASRGIDQLRAAMAATGTGTVDDLERSLRSVVGSTALLLDALSLRRSGVTRGDLGHWAAVSLIALGPRDPDEARLAALRDWDDGYLDDVLGLRAAHLRGNLAQAAAPALIQTDPPPAGLLMEPWQWSGARAVVPRDSIEGVALMAAPATVSVRALASFPAGEPLEVSATRIAVQRAGLARVIQLTSGTVPVIALAEDGAATADRVEQLSLAVDQTLHVLAVEESSFHGPRLWVWLGNGEVTRLDHECCELVREPTTMLWVHSGTGDGVGGWLAVSDGRFDLVPWDQFLSARELTREPARAPLGDFLTADSSTPRIDGAQLIVWRRGHGPPLFVLHGGPGLGSGYLREPLTETLGSERELVFFDQRGSGYSEGAEHPEDLTMRRLVDDLDLLRQRAGLDRIDVLGHSFGGLLALHYAVRYPEHLGRMVLVDPDPASREEWEAFEGIVATKTPPSDAEEIARLERLAGWQESPEIMTAWFGLRLRGYTASPETADAIPLEFDEPTLVSFRTTYPAIRADLGDWDLHDRIPGIEAPTLVIAAGNGIFPVEAATRLADELANGELVVLDDIGHFPFVEAPDRFARPVLEFLARSRR